MVADERARARRGEDAWLDAGRPPERIRPAGLERGEVAEDVPSIRALHHRRVDGRRHQLEPRLEQVLTGGNGQSVRGLEIPLPVLAEGRVRLAKFRDAFDDDARHARGRGLIDSARRGLGAHLIDDPVRDRRRPRAGSGDVLGVPASSTCGVDETRGVESVARIVRACSGETCGERVPPVRLMREFRRQFCLFQIDGKQPGCYAAGTRDR